MKLKEFQKVFISRWGDMGARWGVGKSVGMVHAFLYLSPDPVCADEICDALNMARSNVAQALKELEAWNLVFREARLGDRKLFYRSESDVWQMARCIAIERKKREADGALRAVSECLGEADLAKDSFTEKRMRAMEEILNDCNVFAETALRFDNSILRKTIKAAGKIFRWISQ